MFNTKNIKSTIQVMMMGLSSIAIASEAPSSIELASKTYYGYPQNQQETGNIKLSAVLTKGGKPIPGNIYWRIYPYTEGELPRNARAIKYSSQAEPNFKLPAGKYTVQLQYNRFKKQSYFEIEANKNQQKAINLHAGLVKVKAKLGKNGAPIDSNLRWEVNKAEADFFEKHQKVSSSYKPVDIFLLPEGKYQLKATFVRLPQTQNFELKAGDKKVIELPINAGFLKVKATARKNGQALTEGVSFNITNNSPDFAGNFKSIAWGSGKRGSFVLKPGKYIVKTRYGTINKEEPIEIKVGKTIEHVVNLNAGGLRLKANLTNGNAPQQRVRWQIERADSKLNMNSKPMVTSSYKAMPTFVLPAGKYFVHATWGQNRKTTEVEIVPDKFQDIVITLDK